MCIQLRYGLNEFVCLYPGWLKCEKEVSILEFFFQKWKPLHISEENDLNYPQRHNFACDNFLKEGQTNASSSAITLLLMNDRVEVYKTKDCEHLLIQYNSFER